MARIGFGRGPDPQLQITNANQIIAGLTISRFWDDGPILLIAEVKVQNDTAALRTYTLPLFRDLVPLGTANAFHSIAAGGTEFIHRVWIEEFPSGVATFQVGISGDVALSGQVPKNDAHLIILQLPRFDLGEQIPGP